MMSTSRAQNFEDLNVYQRSKELTLAIYETTRKADFSRDFSLRDQIRRASISVISNIAEGFERGSDADFVRFLYISKGSCGEVRAQIAIAFELGYLDAKTQEQIHHACRRISGMLSNLISYLKQKRKT